MSVVNHLSTPYTAVRPSPNGKTNARAFQSLARRSPPPIQKMLPIPKTIEATGLSEEFLYNLTLRTLLKKGMMTGGKLADELCLHFSGVVEPILDFLKGEHLVEVKDGSHLSPATYRYTITGKGNDKVKEAAMSTGYTGPCPVTLEQYTRVVEAQAKERPELDRDIVKHALWNLVLPSDAVGLIGPAVMTFRSLFLFGPPGNGKTSIAKAIGRHLLGSAIFVPYAIYYNGQVIKVYNPKTHQALPESEKEDTDAFTFDKRWTRCRPPLITAGGELTLPALDLAYNEASRCYEAPLQLKANGGMFLIDDFGRQQMQPDELLNRWIVPLENQIDYLHFNDGNQVEIPFKLLVVFSTNLKPKDLVDDAFLRRIRHKLGINYPSPTEFYHIFIQVCRQRGLEFNQEAFRYLIEHYYKKTPKRPFQACHARDLLDLLIDFAHFEKTPVCLSVELIDKAAKSYFAELF